MSRKLRHWLLILVAVVLTASSKDANASHAMGADLTYECLGGNTYKVRLSFYRDCIGIPAPANIYVNIRSVSCGQNLGVTCYPIPGTGQEVTYLCPTANSTCNGGTFTGIQEWVYEGIVTIPMQCPDWLFSYSLCCRNAAITTISSPGSNTFFIYASLNNTITPCNSSPTFTNKPVPFACLGQQLCFNHGAIDPDGDSLVYTLVNPKQTATNDVSYINPYNAGNPLASSPALQFNNQTGDICFTPTQLQVTVMAVLVQEYRNGVLIGYVVRDIQVTVLNCVNDLPTLTGINGTNDFDMTVCANEPFCFDVFSNDINAGQQVSLFWNSGVGGATFNSAGAPHPTGTFCWTPTTADISNAPHCFTVRVSDDACPYIGSNTYSYCITVTGIVVDAGPDQYIACSDQATITANATGGTAPYTYLWSNGFTGPAQTVPVGTYVVTVSDGNCSSTDTVNVLSAFQPVADFTWTGGCSNEPVIFSDQSNTPGGMQSWTWDFGDGTGSVLQNPVHTFPGSGTYNVSLIVQNIYGCIDTLVLPLTLAPLPVPSFTVDTACAGSLININNTSTPPGTSWNWVFSNGTSSNAQNPSVVLGSAGTYSATLVVTDSLGCSDTLTQNIVVNPQPVAAFNVSGNNCQGAQIVFTNTSSGATGYYWDFGDGNTSSQQNPGHVYGNNGTYTATLIVTNAFGCSDTIQHPVQVNAPPVAAAGPDMTICIGSNATITANGGISYSWTPGGMTGSTISVSPASDTTYYVTVTDANGCTDVDSVNVFVNPLPTPTVSPNVSICQGQNTVLVAGGGISYSWNPSGNTNDTISVSPGSSTTYAVNVIDANGCQATAFVNVTVNPNPAASLPAGVFICSGVSATLDPGAVGTTYQWSTGATSQSIQVNAQGAYMVTVTNQFGCTTSATAQVTVGGQVISNNNTVAICQGQTAVLGTGITGSSYVWSNGSTSQTISVGTAGVYSVTVTDQNGCTGTIANTVQVNPLPQAAFTPNDECLRDSVFFFDASTVNGGSITSWSWNLGDGNISYAQNPIHVYNTPGAFNITLTVTSNQGCTSTLNDTLNIYPMPSADFSFSQGCVGTGVPFTDQSTVGFGNIVSWNWSFDDGTTSTQQNPVHVYSSPGIYTVLLTVATPGGCSATRHRVIQVYPEPALSFTSTPTNICQGGSVTLNNTSTSTNGAINTWQWSFGNGNTSTQMNPTVTYTTAGTYTVTLIGTTSHGCTDTLTQVVTVNALPLADAGSNRSICRGQSVSLSATGGGTYAWSPVISNASSITVSPTNNTTYYVVVTNANGCTSIDSVVVTVRALPTPNAGPDRSLCAGGTVSLTATGGGSYLWTPGGSTSATISVSPAATQNYIVTVTAANGCSRNDTARVVVNALPTANAGPDKTICFGTTTSLSASGGLSYLWQHNGATTATVYVNPTAASTYVVTVTNASGCTARDTVNVTINPTPVVSGSNAFFCTGFSATLDAGNAGLSYLWTPSGATTQTVTVSDPGTYTVVVTNAFGCQGSGTFNVTEGGTGLSPTPVNVVTCQGTNITLDAGNPGMNYLWSTGAVSQTINVNSSGSYQVTITDPGGCSASFTNNVNLQPLPIVNFSTSNACEGAVTSLNNLSTISSGSISTWQWSVGNGMTSTAQQPSFAFPAAGTYPVTLVATSGFGCVDSATGSVTIDPLPSAAFSAPDVCEGSPTLFSDASLVSSGALNAWSWNLGDGSTSTQANPQHTYAAEGVYTVSLIVSTAAGCADTVLQSITVDPMPVADFNVQDVCEGDSVRFYNSSQLTNGMISDINWDFGDGNTSSDPDPVHYYAAPGSYTVTLRVGSDQACEDQIAKTVLVNPKPLADFNTSPVCSGTPVSFSNLSGVGSGTLNGWYWEFGDGAFSASQNPSHQYANAGTFTVTLVATSDKGCRDTASRQATINDLPQGGFTVSNTCFGNPAVFTDTSSVQSGNVTTWNWNFGDGSSSSAQNPAHLYTGTGTYTVQLVVSSSAGCVDTVSRSINVFPVPNANFSSNNVCLNGPTSFVDQSQITGGGSFQYSWNFGDNNTDTLMNPQHLYTAAGTYTVSMTVTSPYGCSASVSRPVTVFPLPQAGFSAGDVCMNQPVQLIDNSVITQGSISGWSWSLGDASTSTAQHPTHFYNAPGYYTVTLEVTSDQGCKNSITDSVEIFAAPSPQPTAGSGCVGTYIPLMDTSSGAGNNIVSWDWNFGNGNTGTQANESALYTVAGTYTVTLTTTNANGCRATATTNVIISPLPNAGFTSGTACLNSPVQFTNTSSISGGGTLSGYSWDFGDGSGSSASANPAYTYSQPGTYTVTLIAFSNDGCTDTISGQIIVNPLPVAQFSDMNGQGCGPILVQFTDSSFISSGNVVSWSWDFGDGGTSSAQHPSHVYVNSGNYPVTLTVVSDSGCIGTMTMNNAVTVYPGPDAEFEADPALQNILNPNFDFINLSSGALTYAWTFGDGGSSTVFEPSHSYRDTGNYMVTLWVTNAYGCRDSVQHLVRVDPIFSWWVPNAFTPNGDGMNEGFNVKGEYIADVKLSIFNRWGDQIFFSEGRDNLPWDGSVAGRPEPAQEGVYVFQVRVTDVWGMIHEKIGHVSLVR
ncbi:MAG: PKD domain-containing protein [Bacteroidia bacterium]|nr:PKD domain-containing protein [Bacteroidia bacterium]